MRITWFNNEIKKYSQVNSWFSQFNRPKSFLFSTSGNSVVEADRAPSPSIDRSQVSQHGTRGGVCAQLDPRHRPPPGRTRIPRQDLHISRVPVQGDHQKCKSVIQFVGFIFDEWYVFERWYRLWRATLIWGGGAFTIPRTATLTLIRLRLLNDEYMYIKTSQVFIFLYVNH